MKAVPNNPALYFIPHYYLDTGIVLAESRVHGCREPDPEPLTVRPGLATAEEKGERCKKPEMHFVSL
jgi:hypothetical protein